MPNRWIEYEAAMDSGLEAGGAEPEAVEATEEAAPEWSPPGQEWYGNIDQFVQQAGPVLQQLGQQMSQAQQASEYSQYEEPSYVEGETDPVQYVQDLVNARVAEALSGYEPILGYVAQREAENATRDALAGLETTIGKFDHDQAVFLSLGLQNQGLDPEQALQVAAQRQREFEERIRNEAVDEYKASLARPREEIVQQPGTATGAATEVEPLPTGPDKYTILAERWAQDQ